MASRRKECRCETTEDGYVLYDTIFSKRGFCRRRGAKWDPASRSLRFPLSAANNTKKLVSAYYEAEYDADSLAGYHRKDRRDTAARGVFCAASVHLMYTSSCIVPYARRAASNADLV